MIRDKKLRKKNIKVFKIIFISFLTIWNICVFTNLIFYTDKFRKPNTSIHLKNYLTSNNYKELDLLSTEEKIADFQYMIDFMYENYPLIHIDEEIYGIDFEQKNDNFYNIIKNTENDFEFYVALQKYFSSIKSTHTYLMFPDLSIFENKNISNLVNIIDGDINKEQLQYWRNLLYENVKNYDSDNMVIFNYIDGKYYETKFNDAYITNINGQPIQEFINNYDSILDKKISFEKNILYFDKLIFNNIQGEPVLICMNNGEEYNLYLDSEYEFSYIYTLDSKEPEIFYIIDEEKRVCYYRIDSFEIKYLDKIRKLSEEIIDKKENIDSIIFDIRNNGGGKMGTYVVGILNLFINKEYKFIRKYYIPFTEYHSNFKEKNVNNKITKDPIKGSKNKSRFYYVNKGKINYGKNQSDVFKNIYVLIGEETGSAADTFAAVMKSGNHAVLVGQNTAGEGLGDTSSIFRLPNSGLYISFMGSYGLNKDGTSNSKYGTAPDYYIEQDISDYKKGINVDTGYLSIDQMLQYDTQLNFIISNLN